MILAAIRATFFQFRARKRAGQNGPLKVKCIIGITKRKKRKEEEGVGEEEEEKKHRKLL